MTSWNVAVNIITSKQRFRNYDVNMFSKTNITVAVLTDGIGTINPNKWMKYMSETASENYLNDLMNNDENEHLA